MNSEVYCISIYVFCIRSRGLCKGQLSKRRLHFGIQRTTNRLWWEEKESLQWKIYCLHVWLPVAKHGGKSKAEVRLHNNFVWYIGHCVRLNNHRTIIECSDLSDGHDRLHRSKPLSNQCDNNDRKGEILYSLHVIFSHAECSMLTLVNITDMTEILTGSKMNQSCRWLEGIPGIALINDDVWNGWNDRFFLWKPNDCWTEL